MMEAFGKRNCQGPGKVNARAGRLPASDAKSRAVKGAPETAIPSPLSRRRNSRRDVLEENPAQLTAAQLMPQAYYAGGIRQFGKYDIEQTRRKIRESRLAPR